MQLLPKCKKSATRWLKPESLLKEKENKFENESQRLKILNEKLKSKLVNYQELFDHNQRMIVLGNKLNDLAERFFQNNKKKTFNRRLVAFGRVRKCEKKTKNPSASQKNREVKKEVAARSKSETGKHS